MANDLDRTADAAIACALRSDADGMASLVTDMDALQLRKLAVRLAARTAEALTEWAADAGATPEQTLMMWQAAILRARREESEREAEGDGGA
ncbi:MULTISPECIES: hypothetical protein [Streptomycetaceae]|uniref:Uncharacterized protein n=1 Tax=Streptantibioticus parmotrematis TaxID=2873249 RepID=A0ABS7QJQ8_9ACTN|nr:MULTISPECIES: hypothetical protein [Streptomycetaceae]MBY8883408.1 hypothetical protein [Streptantibioticus parmotrematis]PWI42804.1 hypothetical protein CK485_11030 [Streptomyces sp. ICBB 8177]